MSTALYLGIGGGVLLLIIIIVAVLMMGGKKEDTNEIKEEESTSNPAPAPSAPAPSAPAPSTPVQETIVTPPVITVKSSVTSPSTGQIKFTELVSDDGLYKLVQQTDGNLVVYKIPENTPIWSSMETTGFSQCNPVTSCKYNLKFQDDCNLVTYKDDTLNPAWSALGTNKWRFNSNLQALRPCELKLQNDKNLVIYNKNRGVVWSSLA